MSKFRTLLLAHHVSENHPIQRVVKQFCENVSQRTDGQLVIATVPNSSLGNIPELLRMVIDGSADMTFATYDRLVPMLPRFGCISLPFVFDDLAHVDRLVNDDAFRAWVLADLENLGLVLLGSWEWGFRQITNSRHPVLRPEDMRGLKIRVPPVELYRATILALGGVPVMVEYARLPSVIRQGLIDGQENPVAVIPSLGLRYVQRYLSLLNYSYGILAHLINRNSFTSLTAQQQSILCEESCLAGQLMCKLLRTQEAGQLDVLASQGMQIDRPPLAPFKNLMPPLYARLGENYGRENMRAFFAMVERQRKAPEILAR